MATMKRRIVYLSDEQWTSLQEQAARGGTTISEFIRTGLMWVPNDAALTGEANVEFHAPSSAMPVTKRGIRDGQEIVRPIVERGFNTRPFTPVPKKGHG